MLSILFFFGMQLFSASLYRQGLEATQRGTTSNCAPFLAYPLASDGAPMYVPLSPSTTPMVYPQFPAHTPLVVGYASPTAPSPQMRAVALDFVPGASQHLATTEAAGSEQAGGSERGSASGSAQDIKLDNDFQTGNPLTYNLDFSSALMPEIIIRKLGGDSIPISKNGEFTLNGFNFKLEDEAKMDLITGNSKGVILSSVNELTGEIGFVKVVSSCEDNQDATTKELQVVSMKAAITIDENEQLLRELEGELDKLEGEYDITSDRYTHFADLIKKLASEDVLFEFEDKGIASKLYIRFVELQNRIEEFSDRNKPYREVGDLEDDFLKEIGVLEEAEEESDIEKHISIITEKIAKSIK